MKKVKALVASGLLITSMIVTSVVASAAWSEGTYEYGGYWNRGVRQSGNKVMAYSYYYHGSRIHFSYAGDRYGTVVKSVGGKGTTCANGLYSTKTSKVVGYNFGFGF